MSRIIVKGTSPNEDKIIAIFEPNDNGSFDCYSLEDKKFTITSKQKREYKTFPRSSPYVMIRKNERDADLKELNIRGQCKLINKEAEKLKELTNDKINLFRTGSVAKTALTAIIL